MTQGMPEIDPQAATDAAVSAPRRPPPPAPPPPPADEISVPPVGAGLKPAPTQSPPAGQTDRAGTSPAPTLEPVGAPLAGAPVPSAPSESEEPETTVELDPALLQFVLSPQYQSSHESIKKIFNLKDDDIIFISDLDRLVMAGQLDLEAYLVALEDEFGERLPDDQRDKLYAQLLAERFVPLGDRLKPTAIDVARTEGLSLPAVPHYQVYSKPFTYSGAATEIATAAGFSIMGGPIRERLRELIISKIKGVRTDAQVLEALTRGIDFGGLGLDKKTADRTLEAMNDILKRAKVLSEDEYANWLADETRKKAAPVQPPQALSADDAEIAQIQANMPQSGADASTELAKAVEMTVQRISYRPDSDYLAKRLRNAISSRLRDVRSALELKQILMRDTKVGGLGIPAADADGVAKQIEAAYQEFHEAISKEEKSKIEIQMEDQKRKVETRRRQEAEEHAKWFEDKIRARKAGETEKTQVIEDMRRVMAAGPTSPIDVKEQRAETAQFGPLVPVVTSGVTKPVLEPVGTGFKPAPTPAPKSAVKVSPATAELAQAAVGTRPRMDGVTYAGPQLVGLVGELKSLTVAEFRRLSKDPQEAAKKIRQKIETLTQESFEKKVEGIRAFQSSPLQAAYMGLVGESFRTAKPVVALADEKRAAGEDTLSPDEIAAIIQLNSELHF